MVVREQGDQQYLRRPVGQASEKHARTASAWAEASEICLHLPSSKQQRNESHISFDNARYEL